MGLLLLFIGCSKKKTTEFEPGRDWLQTMRKQIIETIADSDRKDTLLKVVSQFDLALGQMDRSVQDFYKKLIAVDENYHSTAKDFQNVFDDFNQKRMSFRERLIDLRFQMVNLTSPEEWNQLADIGNKETLFLNWQRQPEIKN